MTFLTATPPLARALAERNFDRLTQVQTAVLADDAAGRDLLVSAQTGSGKTVAYGLAIANNLLDGAERFERAGAPLALIVAPTRELALQVHRELAWLYQHADARVVSCVGGMDPRREQRELAAGAHIVVGTPGRLCDHLRRGRLDISELKADRARRGRRNARSRFSRGYGIHPRGHAGENAARCCSRRRCRAASSRWRKSISKRRFASKSRGDEGGHADIEYRAIRIAAGDVEHAVVNILRFFESPSALVFCNTREAVRHLQATLLGARLLRRRAVGRIDPERAHPRAAGAARGRARVCVATDVAARGIDLPNLDLVIHADIPNDPEVMQHRSGRTGRAGRKGVSIILVPPARKRRAEVLLNLAGIDASLGHGAAAG